MQLQLSHYVTTLRITAGFLGEREQFRWWQSSFLAEWSSAYLEPVFARTQLVAKYTGVVQAASLVHDERIGVGRVYHLFRLPEAFEQELRQVLVRPEFGRAVDEMIASREGALNFLRQQSADYIAQSVGPVRVGQSNEMYELSTWHTVTAHYAHGFEANQPVLPYFVDAQ